MANLNKVMLIGRLTRDPESVTFSNGGKVSKFGFAVNNRKKDQQSGEWVDDPVFLDCEVYNRGEAGREADRVEQNLRKGQQIFIEGHFKMDRWVDKKDGTNRTRLVIIVDNFQYLEPRADGAPPPRPSAPAARASAPAARRPEPSHYAGGGGAGHDDEEPEMDAPGARGAAGGGEEEIPF
jgi:single-strand DNA-binding protein